ncbi:transcriptional regulator [Rhodocyclus tenuis]|uniref:Transcriptional regulator n=2 Tax=Rhodocyclus TaxID=1064 RepID=A0A6L5JYS2_RHOTE|nr:transcriptional regulator [Rhodocyclus gracilis]MQY51972.1 transcriptional regulator [Rhodocyclus gracilis]MRD73750.1 transcriptional regulator [Rhodocyclus gracilis]NJA89774.1 transcriptional regulator [Rhodocyclus gracilis]
MTAPSEIRSLLTVITEAALENTLLHDFEGRGVHGCTVSDARGRGQRGVRDAAWGEAANVRIEVICRRECAEALLDHLQRHYFNNYAMVAFVQEVVVLRPNKF